MRQTYLGMIKLLKDSDSPNYWLLPSSYNGWPLDSNDFFGGKLPVEGIDPICSVADRCSKGKEVPMFPLRALRSLREKPWRLSVRSFSDSGFRQLLPNG